MSRKKYTAQEKRELIDRVREWQLLSPDSRMPATQVELARELGCTAGYISQLLKRTPSTVLDSLVEGDTEAMSLHRRIVRSIAEDAAKGDRHAREQYLKYISEPYRVPKKRESSRMPDVVRRAMELMPTYQIEKEKREAKRVNRTQEDAEASTPEKSRPN